MANYRNILEQKKGQKQQIEHQLHQLKKDRKYLKRDLKRHEQALEVVKAVAIKTQERIQFHISDITSLALESVFPDPYELVAEFVQRRNKTECDLYFSRNGEKADPLSASGGGAVDVAAFALRVASWSMQKPKSRNVLVLDEPFRYLSSDLLPKASEMLQQISQDLNLQIIMVSHSEELIESADKVFVVNRDKKGVSHIKEEGGINIDEQEGRSS